MKIGAKSFLTHLRDAVIRPLEADLNRLTGKNTTAKTKAVGPLPPGQKDTAYDGALVGANGQAYSANTPLASVPPVLPRSGTPGKETILFVNGVSTAKDKEAAEMQALADKTGEPVIGVHNATQGALKDYAQTIEDRADFGKNPAVDSMADLVYSKIKNGEPVRIAGYSQGGLICSRALEHVENRLQLEDGLTAAQAKQRMGLVTCETFASAASRYPDGPHYVEYINRHDPVQLFSFRAFGEDPGNPLVHKGAGAITHAFSTSLSSAANLKAHGLDTYLAHYVPFQNGLPA